MSSDAPPLGESKRSRCPLCGHATVDFVARVSLALGAARRCPICMAAWKFPRIGWLYRLPLNLLFILEVALLISLGLGLPAFLALASLATFGAVVPLLLPLETQPGDSVTERATRRFQN
jgi:hypothetical protein